MTGLNDRTNMVWDPFVGRRHVVRDAFLPWVQKLRWDHRLAWAIMCVGVALVAVATLANILGASELLVQIIFGLGLLCAFGGGFYYAFKFGGEPGDKERDQFAQLFIRAAEGIGKAHRLIEKDEESSLKKGGLSKQERLAEIDEKSKLAFVNRRPDLRIPAPQLAALADEAMRSQRFPTVTFYDPDFFVMQQHVEHFLLPSVALAFPIIPLVLIWGADGGEPFWLALQGHGHDVRRPDLGPDSGEDRQDGELSLKSLAQHQMDGGKDGSVSFVLALPSQVETEPKIMLLDDGETWLEQPRQSPDWRKLAKPFQAKLMHLHARYGCELLLNKEAIFLRGSFGVGLPADTAKLPAQQAVLEAQLKVLIAEAQQLRSLLG